MPLFSGFFRPQEDESVSQYEGRQRKRARVGTTYDPNEDPDVYQSYDPAAMEEPPESARLRQTAEEAPPTFQRPKLSNRRQILGNMALIFGGRGGLGRAGERALHQPVEDAYLDYETSRQHRADTLQGQEIGANVAEHQQTRKYGFFAGERKGQQEEIFNRARTANQISQIGRNESESALHSAQAQKALETTFGAPVNVGGRMTRFPTNAPMGVDVGAAPPKEFRPNAPRISTFSPGQGIAVNGRITQQADPKVYRQTHPGAAGRAGARGDASSKHWGQYQGRKTAIDKMAADQMKTLSKTEMYMDPKTFAERKAEIEQNRQAAQDANDKDYQDLASSLGEGRGEDPGLYRDANGKLIQWNADSEEWEPYEGDDEGEQ